MQAPLLKCPRCDHAREAAGPTSAPMRQAATAAGFTMHGCLACGGIFLDTRAAQLLIEKLPVDAMHLSAGAAAAARYAPNLDSRIHCPVCAKPMTRSRVERAGVDIDKCAEHGTFYDRHELNRIADAIRQSGWGAPLPGQPPVRAPVTVNRQSGLESAAADAVTGVAVGVAVVDVLGFFSDIFN